MVSVRPAPHRDPTDQVRLGLIGSGRIGTCRGQRIARRIPEALLAAGDARAARSMALAGSTSVQQELSVRIWQMIGAAA